MKQALQMVLIGMGTAAAWVGFADSLGLNVQTVCAVFAIVGLVGFLVMDYLTYRTTGSSPMTRRSVERDRRR